MKSLSLSILAAMFSAQSFALAPCSDMVLEQFPAGEAHQFVSGSSYDLSEKFYLTAIVLTMREITGKNSLSSKEAYKLFSSQTWGDGNSPSMTIWREVGYNLSGRMESLIEVRTAYKGIDYRSVVLHRVDLQQSEASQWLLCMDKEELGK